MPAREGRQFLPSGLPGPTPGRLPAETGTAHHQGGVVAVGPLWHDDLAGRKLDLEEVSPLRGGLRRREITLEISGELLPNGCGQRPSVTAAVSLQLLRVLQQVSLVRQTLVDR